MNMDDPSKQEQIRRGTHEYQPSAGKHGAYVPAVYKHQEYPKMMGKYPRPTLAQFRQQNGVEIPLEIAQQRLQAAIAEWDQAMTASTVHSKQEEVAWLKEHGN